jgi:hypothetical protein
MGPLISTVLAILSALGLKRLLPAARKHRRQVRFIRETLASSGKPDCRGVIASLSTVPDRIDNLRPTIRSLLKQTRPPDEIVLAIPEFSVRERRPYVVPKHISRFAAGACFALPGGLGAGNEVYRRDSGRAGNGAGEYVDHGGRRRSALPARCARNVSPLQRAIT